jgi:serine/threonine protein kinase/Tol biopolymer transport system component
MSAERWQRVKVLFERALDRPPSVREEVLEKSDESPSIVAEVRELISRDAVAGGFLADAGSAESSVATLLSASDLVSGHFRIVSLLGRGGMGVVYRAEDLVLSRPVALKFLPGGPGGTTQALERLRREARAAAALNHPNICVVYETGEHQGQPFIAMELLQGQTLKQRIGAKRLTTEELLDWAVQIANGLDAAHRNGIVHRDIKPANIFITALGQVKILDFGLAKVAAPVSGGAAELTASPTEEYLTTPGMMIGTVPYMSPEQARGEALDPRTDLFSFGAVLYEMTSGRTAFAGATTALVHQAVLGLTPPTASSVNPNVPPELDRIIGKALEKDRELRYQHAADMGADLKRLKRDTESKQRAFPASAQIPTQQKGGSFRHKLRYGLMLGIALLALGFGWVWFKYEPFAAHRILTERQLTHTTSDNRAIGGAISPDGKYLAYADTKGLHLSVLATGESHDIPLPDEIATRLWEVSWFPDGERLLLTVGTKTAGLDIWLKSIFGGDPRKLRADGRSAMVSPDAKLIAFITSGRQEIFVMGANGENPRKVLSSESEQFGPLAWSPTGQRLAYVKRRSGAGKFGGSIESVALEAGPASLVISDPRLSTDTFAILRWVRDGRLIFGLQDRPASEEMNLWEIRTAPRTGERTGKPAKITNWYGVTPYSASASQDGSRLALTKSRLREEVYVSDLTEKGVDVPRALTLSDSRDHPNGWTRDSGSILFESNRTGKAQIYRQQVGRETAEPVIQGSDDEEGAELSPDGAWILYWSTANGGKSAPTVTRLMRLPASGGSPEQVLQVPIEANPSFDCPSQPGSSCVLGRREQGRLIFNMLDPLQGQGKEVARTQEPVNPFFAISPDGARIAVTSGARLHNQIHILDLRNSTERPFQLPQGLYIWSLSWTADGNAFFAGVQSTDYLLVRIELDGKIRVLLDRGRDQWLSNPLPSPDGRRLAFTQETFESNCWLLENF